MIEKLNTYMLSGVKGILGYRPRQERVVIYSFKNCEIGEYNFFEKGGIAQSFIFDGLY